MLKEDIRRIEQITPVARPSARVIVRDTHNVTTDEFPVVAWALIRDHNDNQRIIPCVAVEEDRMNSLYFEAVPVLLEKSNDMLFLGKYTLVEIQT